MSYGVATPAILRGVWMSSRLFSRAPGEESWVIACPCELRDALAGASKADLARYAGGWAASEELNLFDNDEATLTSLLNDVANLARMAQARNESLYLWMSL